MENFVLIGKAKTVFQIIELMAKGEKAAKARKTEGKTNRKYHQQNRMLPDKPSHNFDNHISLN